MQVVWIATPRFAGLGMTDERAVRLDPGVGATQDAGSALDCSGLAVFAMTGFGLTRPKRPAVYIMASQRNGTLYVGVTSDLARRVWGHRNGSVPGFTKRYGCKLLVYFEVYQDMLSAIAREKQINCGALAGFLLQGSIGKRKFPIGYRFDAIEIEPVTCPAR